MIGDIAQIIGNHSVLYDHLITDFPTDVRIRGINPDSIDQRYLIDCSYEYDPKELTPRLVWAHKADLRKVSPVKCLDLTQLLTHKAQSIRELAKYALTFENVFAQKREAHWDYVNQPTKRITFIFQYNQTKHIEVIFRERIIISGHTIDPELAKLILLPHIEVFDLEQENFYRPLGVSKEIDSVKYIIEQQCEWWGDKKNKMKFNFETKEG